MTRMWLVWGLVLVAGACRDAGSSGSSGRSAAADTDGKVTLFITIDTEDKYFSIPRLITGEGIPDTPGVYRMMDLMERHGFRGNFFFNVYEDGNYQPGTLEKIAKDMELRGHAVELHTHPSDRLPYYSDAIYNYNLAEQMEILKRGQHLIEAWTGRAPVAHRGGGYAFDDMTLYALNRIGIQLDSSRWLSRASNKISTNFTTNRVTSYYNTIEIPITYVKMIKSDGKLFDTKFDLDSLTYDELVTVVELSKQHGLKTLNLFLHSFSFIRKTTKNLQDAEDPSALYRSPSTPAFGKDLVCEIYGVDQVDMDEFDRFLAYLAADDDVEVVLMRDWLKDTRRPEGEYGLDFIPVIDRLPKPAKAEDAKKATPSEAGVVHGG